MNVSNSCSNHIVRFYACKKFCTNVSQRSYEKSNGTKMPAAVRENWFSLCSQWFHWSAIKETSNGRENNRKRVFLLRIYPRRFSFFALQQISQLPTQDKSGKNSKRENIIFRAHWNAVIKQK